MIYPVDSVNQPLNNCAQMYNLVVVDPYISKFCFPSSLRVFLASFRETRLEPSLEKTETSLGVGRSYGDLWSSYQSFLRGLSNCSITDSRALILKRGCSSSSQARIPTRIMFFLFFFLRHLFAKTYLRSLAQVPSPLPTAAPPVPIFQKVQVGLLTSHLAHCLNSPHN